MPEWLERRKAEYARAAQLRVCKKCGAPVLAGLDADIAALKVQIDPTPVDAVGEALAVLAGRGTYELHRSRHGHQIHARYPWNITAPRKRPVYPGHRCGQNLDAHTDHTWAQAAPQRPQADQNTPPY